jgi:hypothetical protein
MQKNILRDLLFLCFLVSTGCGEGTKVRGQVLFDDGMPLSTGTVIFSNDTMTFRGKINSDGYYALGITHDNQKIPQGEYRVSIVGAARETGKTYKTGGHGNPVYEIPVEEYLIDKKLTNPATSGLVVKVPAGNYNLTVTKPVK